MEPSENCYNIIKQFENEPLYMGIIKEAEPYEDQFAKIATIGYGNTYYEDNAPVTLEDRPLSEQQASDLLEYTVNKFAKNVDAHIKTYLNQNQFDALVSFAYNVGIGLFKLSIVLKKVNYNPADPFIRDAFMLFDKSGGKEVQGLKNRRKKEADLYFIPV